jgi:hypothetical protein
MTVQQDPTILPQSDPEPPPNSINVNTLGYYLDGWADLIENMGAEAEEIRTKTLENLKERNMPDIKVASKIGYVALLKPDIRKYTINTRSPGATTAIAINKHGNDLFVCWRTFIRPVLNQTTLWTMLGVAVILGSCGSLSTGLAARGLPFFYVDSFPFGLLIMCSLFLTLVLVLVIEVLVVAFAGRILKGDFLTYFFIEPNVFDADDITAMGLSAHKSLLRALDSTGIDVSKLRLKQDFQGGRRGERI